MYIRQLLEGTGRQSVLELNEGIFFLPVIKSMGCSDDEKGKPLCAWAYHVAYFKVSGGRYKGKKNEHFAFFVLSTKDYRVRNL